MKTSRKNTYIYLVMASIFFYFYIFIPFMFATTYIDFVFKCIILAFSVIIFAYIMNIVFIRKSISSRNFAIKFAMFFIGFSINLLSRVFYYVPNSIDPLAIIWALLSFPLLNVFGNQLE